MCLEIIKRRFGLYSRNPERKGVGWKVFKKSHNYNIGQPIVWGGQFRIFNRFIEPRDKGKWLHETKFREPRTEETLGVGIGKRYLIGWHFYLSRKAAYTDKNEGEVVKKIRFRKAVAFGIQSGQRVGVAKEIMI